MADKICTNFNDDDGFDVGCKLVSKEYALEAYPDLVPWMKVPALWGWGRGSLGQLGNNAAVNASSPVQTISFGTNWKTVGQGQGEQITAIKTDGSLWLWGFGTNGVLGNNSTLNRSSPVQTISGGTNWKEVSDALDVTAAIKTDGTLWTWGSGLNGRIGNNSTLSHSSPVQTTPGGTDWKQVSAGGQHVAATKTDGTLWLWGYGSCGQLGTGAGTSVSTPVQTISGGTNWKSVSIAQFQSGAIKTDGTLWMWGRGTFGVNGDGTGLLRNSPVQTASGGSNWKQISVGCFSAAAIKTDGTLWAWGSATGDNTAISRSAPVQTVSGGTNWKQVSVGNQHMAAIKTDGTLWAWGSGTYGRLGNNNLISISSPVQTVSGGTDWKSVSAKSNNVIAIRDEGDF